ncbi:MAG: 5-methyltetrahydropteroyltriglutamate--homocysteine S-methyltransferase [Actinomycetota bacterium]|nr:5-methyltetrahydropteroyltriglutamate--homocysteine S-methyltransferase [Actinomycetota bacterium]
MIRTTPPFRADHVGSLLRPPELLQAREDFAAGRISAEDLRGVEDEAIREVVRMQEEVGLQSATDGEFRRASWHMDFIYQLGGIEQVEGDIKVEFRNDEGSLEFTPAALRVERRVGLQEPIFTEAFRFLKEQVTTATPKQTIPSPSMVHYRGGRAAIDEEVYPDLEGFWEDLADAYAEEVRALGQLGCTYLQFDDVSLAYLNDPRQRERVANELGGDAEHQHEIYIRTINRAISDKPEGMSITTHMCRGNYRSSWAAEGGYDFVAEALFGELEVDGFFLEYDDARSGGFEPLRFVPKGKMVVLGLVTSKRGELEDKDQLKRRIEEASRFVDIDQLCLSPQCGFSSTFEGNDLTREQQWDKLRLIVETAQEVWG